MVGIRTDDELSDLIVRHVVKGVSHRLTPNFREHVLRGLEHRLCVTHLDHLPNESRRSLAGLLLAWERFTGIRDLRHVDAGQDALELRSPVRFGIKTAKLICNAGRRLTPQDAIEVLELIEPVERTSSVARLVHVGLPHRSASGDHRVRHHVFRVGDLGHTLTDVFR